MRGRLRDRSTSYPSRRESAACACAAPPCGATHRDSYGGIVMVGIVGPLLALVAVIVLGTLVGSF
ncbi:hypothetical protein QTN24_19260 [Cupriavidus sp. SZY C1]|uniref:hypothetical protein n=1 Tax=Cupriavidus sp. SZY C1 TaxID=3055037 RepID=UPI0028BAF698|nr:hypothetical protein [Cupriavidus sp. SZY C1]MDT6963644.1 hypothetical protein [Cupriavidus sp. SZY C1]